MRQKYFTPYAILLFFAFVLIGGGWFWWQILHQHATDSKPFVPGALETTLKEDTQLIVSESGREQVALKAGQRIKIWARHGKSKEYYFLAETPDGKRGVITDFDQKFKHDYVFDYKDGGYKMSTHQFYKECIGKRFDEFDGKYCRTVFVPKHPDRTKSVTIMMPFILRDVDSWKASRPLVTYTDGVATEVRFEQLRKGNRLILRFAPFAGWLLDKEIIQQLISKPQFVEYEPEREKDFRYYLDMLLHLIELVFYFGLFGSIPLFVFMMFLLYTPRKWIGRTALNICVTIIFISLAYLWLLVMIMEGYKWWYIWIPNIIFFWFNIGIYAFSISNQCPHCKHIGTLDRVKSLYKGKDFDVSTRTEEDFHSYRTKEKGKIIETTYRHNPYGSPDVINEKIKDGWINVERGWVEKKTYKVTHQIDKYHNWYWCAKCEKMHERDEDEWRMISKELIDTSISDSYEERSIR